MAESLTIGYIKYLDINIGAFGNGDCGADPKTYITIRDFELLKDGLSSQTDLILRNSNYMNAGITPPELLVD